MAEQEPEKTAEAGAAEPAKEIHPLTLFAKITEALRLHHDVGNGVHTELLAQADAFLKEHSASEIEQTDKATEGHVGSDNAV
jgi:uncharacterized NAD-dependent epimerase/dehydratase family protein